MLKKILTIICITLLSATLSFSQSTNSSDAVQWLGVFTTETYPVFNCQIIKLGEAIYASSFNLRFVVGNRSIDSEELYRSKQVAKTLKKGDDNLKKIALTNGFNAVIHRKIIDIYSDDYILIEGTPVKIVCN